MIYQPTFDQDEDVLMLNPDPETAAFDDEDDDDFDGAEFDDLGSGATSGYGEDDLADIEDEFDDDDLDEDLDDDSIDDDLDDDSME
ncbi:adhesin [Spirosoma sp. RP8]|uniref:Adhesin n=1 Tax=Spirosoma liriopis TaxID=2937440 RepID=A0ABT0HKY4_9BACT|nr:adhesin [Spirosoma liriopis]MCK8492808.1 adhesin [Spirosoma liriopis]